MTVSYKLGIPTVEEIINQLMQFYIYKSGKLTQVLT